MIKPSRELRSHCPINFGLEIFGDRWTLLVLRDLLFQDKRGFREFQASEEGISTNILADRLDRLVQAGLITSRRVEGDSRQIHYEPTAAGRALVPVLVEMAYWGATHDHATKAPAEFARAYETDRTGLLQAIAAGTDPSKGTHHQTVGSNT